MEDDRVKEFDENVSGMLVMELCRRITITASGETMTGMAKGRSLPGRAMSIRHGLTKAGCREVLWLRITLMMTHLMLATFPTILLKATAFSKVDPVFTKANFLIIKDMEKVL